MLLSHAIFKVCDICGIVGQRLNVDIVHQVGPFFGSAALSKSQTAVVIGRDGRPSGSELSAALAAALWWIVLALAPLRLWRRGARAAGYPNILMRRAPRNHWSRGCWRSTHTHDRRRSCYRSRLFAHYGARVV